MKMRILSALAVVAILLAAVLAPAMGALSLMNNSNSSFNESESLTPTPTPSPPIAESDNNATDTYTEANETEIIDDKISLPPLSENLRFIGKDSFSVNETPEFVIEIERAFIDAVSDADSGKPVKIQISVEGCEGIKNKNRLEVFVEEIAPNKFKVTISKPETGELTPGIYTLVVEVGEQAVKHPFEWGLEPEMLLSENLRIIGKDSFSANETPEFVIEIERAFIDAISDVGGKPVQIQIYVEGGNGSRIELFVEEEEVSSSSNAIRYRVTIPNNKAGTEEITPGIYTLVVAVGEQSVEHTFEWGLETEPEMETPTDTSNMTNSINDTVNESAGINVTPTALAPNLTAEPPKEIKELQQWIYNQSYKYTVAENWVTRLSPDERKALCGYRHITPSEELLSENVRFFSEVPKEKEEPKILQQGSPPSSYDAMAHGNVTPVKNQGSLCGSCWIFGAVAEFESDVLINESQYSNLTLDFSEQEVGDCNIWSRVGGYDFCEGGNAYMTTNYFTKYGSANESCHPYAAAPGTCSNCPLLKNVNNWRMITGADGNESYHINTIKNAILNYGPVYSTIYASDPGFSAYDSGVYEYWGPEETNHAIEIIGWNDSLGAWLIKNSWGTDWGASGPYLGCAWIAYGAANLGDRTSAISGYKNPDPGDVIFYHDECGWGGDAGYESQTAYGAVRFTPSRDSNLTAVDFWAVNASMTYEIKIFDTLNSHPTYYTFTEPLGTTQTGTTNESGYYSIPLNTPVSLVSGDDFIVQVKLTTTGYGYPLPIEDDGPVPSIVSFSDESYCSSGGSEFTKPSWDIGIRARAFDPTETRYMRSDQQIVNGLAAYKLVISQSDTSASHVIERTGGGGYTINWGIRVWKRDSGGTEYEITGGTPVAQVSRAANGEGLLSTSWDCPQTSLNSTDAIVVGAYAEIVGQVSWTEQATFTTEQLSASQLDSAIWTVNYYTKYESKSTGPPTGKYTRGTFYWGTSTYNSRIGGFSWTEADTEPPQWSNATTNKTTIYQNDYVKFTANWTDDVGLTGYKFSINQTGGWVNSSFIPFSGFSNVSENITQITASAGTTVQWRFYANDTSDNRNVTDIQTFVVQSAEVITPVTPFMIYGRVFYEDGSECLNPTVKITNLNNSKQWSAKTNASYNYYQRILANGTDLNASEILQFNVSDGIRYNVTNYTVTPADINDGGLFNFNFTLPTPPSPSTPYMIYGWVFYKNGTACNNPTVNITNMNNSKQWQAEINASYNFYQITLAGGTDLNASEILQFHVKAPDASQFNTTNHTVTPAEIDSGGLFGYNITLEAPETPFMIYGWVNYSNGTPCNGPTVTINNTNTSTEWQAETNASYNYYQLILDTSNISTGNVLKFNATDGTQFNVTNHTVTQKNITDGGLFNFNLTLPSLITEGPTVESITITPDDEPAEDGVQINPTPGANKTVNISAVVSDPNGWDDVDTVNVTITGSGTVADSPVNLTYVSNSSLMTATYNGTFNMSFYYLNGTYTVDVTATDVSSLTGSNLTTFEYQTAIALELDTNMINFSISGPIDPGETSEVFGDEDMSTLDNATVRNIGNVVIDVNVNGTDMTSAGSVITKDNIDARVDALGYLNMSMTRFFDVNMTVGNLSLNNTDFKLYVPFGTPQGNYTGTITLTAVQS